MKYGTVYRLENSSNGGGPYCSSVPGGYNYEVYCLVHKKGMQKNHPTPERDIGRETVKGEFCGFISISQLKRWFCKTDLEFILSHNFSIMRYENVSIEAVGKSQCIFKKVDYKTKKTNITDRFRIKEKHES
jgi:hypothetical protein